MRAIPLIRCLPKMSPSSSTHTGSQIATRRRSLTWTRRESSFHLQSLLTGQMFRWLPAFVSEPGSTRYSSHRQSQLSDLTIRLNITTSLKSISQKRWLLSPNIQTSTKSKQCHVTTPLSVIPVHKYVNVHSGINYWTSVKLIIDDHWQWLSFNAKLACNKMPSY